MSGQSVYDRVVAAKHTITGSDLDKSVCKATTEEIMGPKKKHLDYLMHCSNAPQINIPELADKLTNRALSQNWVVVFKSLVTCHHLMIYGNEKLIQYIATRNVDLNLPNFLDKTGVQGYEMSTYIRRYAKYVNQKAVSYRQVAFDFCRVKRGKEDGLLRSMHTEKLLKTLPILQDQLDCLLEFEVNSSQLSNGVITGCFMLLFKDCIRLFACYNDGIINLLEKFFEMCKKDCKVALDLYQKFLIRMDKVSEFLKVAEQVGIDKGEIPDLAKALSLESGLQWLTDLLQAPSSLLDALKQHVQSMESSKKTQWVKPATIATAVSAFTSNLANIDPEEKKQALEEEQLRLASMKMQTHTSPPVSELSAAPTSNNPFTNTAPPQAVTSPFTNTSAPQAVTSPFTNTSAPPQAVTAPVTAPPSQDLFSVATTNSSQSQPTSKPSEDLMGLTPNPMAVVQATLQAQSQMMHPGMPSGSPWSSPNVGRALKVPRPRSPFDDNVGNSASAPASIVDSFLGGDNTQSLAPTNPFTNTAKPSIGSPSRGYERHSWTPSILEPEGGLESGGNAVADLEAFFSSPSVSPSGTPTRQTRSGMLPPTNSPSPSTNSLIDPGLTAYSARPIQTGVMQTQVGANFDQAFGTASTKTSGGAELLGEVMQPMNKRIEPTPPAENLVSNGTSKDIDSTLAHLATNLNMKGGTPKKADHQWTKNPSKNMKTGGANWAPQQTTSTTTWPQGQQYMGGQPADWRSGAFSGQFVAPNQQMGMRTGMAYNAAGAQQIHRPPTQQNTDPFGSL
ncbi:phosphatidylinositol-binding clathrin assembly protein-like isoform X3 [Antedon mediterranea]|uniref:phosphatidylinositol-binding clathrin assembly protein-like isoform X3 n=2 Tax=Antedon mediterranea TaxID=105859 RepID=UPI003AF7BD19